MLERKSQRDMKLSLDMTCVIICQCKIVYRL